jgi:hypothetical protein
MGHREVCRLASLDWTAEAAVPTSRDWTAEAAVPTWFRLDRGRRRSRLGGGYGALLREAFAAEYGAALGGAEGDSCLLAALRADGAGFDTGEVMRVAHGLRGAGEDGYALGFAVLAALGFVPEILVAEEDLFPGGKDEVGPAVDASQYSILKFHRGWLPCFGGRQWRADEAGAHD